MARTDVSVVPGGIPDPKSDKTVGDALHGVGAAASVVTGAGAAAGAAFMLAQSLLGKTRKWQLVGLDGEMQGKAIKGHFTGEGYTENISTMWGSLAIPKRRTPFTQWMRGEHETVTFDCLFFAERDIISRGEHIFGLADLMDDLKALKRTVIADPKLGRPPTFRFMMGDIEFDTCVESIGGVVFDELRKDGKVKAFSCSLTLRKIIDRASVVVTDPSSLKSASKLQPVVSGETYETIARNEYRQPLVGVMLRNVQDSDGTFVNPKVFPKAGDIVHLPEKGFFRNIRITPTSKHLGDSVDAVAARQRLIDSYAGETSLPFVYQGAGAS